MKPKHKAMTSAGPDGTFYLPGSSHLQVIQMHLTIYGPTYSILSISKLCYMCSWVNWHIFHQLIQNGQQKCSSKTNSKRGGGKNDINFLKDKPKLNWASSLLLHSAFADPMDQSSSQLSRMPGTMLRKGEPETCIDPFVPVRYSNLFC